MSDKAPSPLARFIGEGIILAAIPIAASLVAYLFEFGYLSFYEAPPTLIQLDISRILSSLIVVIGSFALYLWIGLLVASTSTGKHPLTRAVGKALLFPVAWLPFFVLLPEMQYRWSGFLALFLGPLLIDLAAPMFQRKSGLKYWDRLAASEEKPTPPTSLKDETIVGKYGAIVVTPILVTLMFGFLIVLLGDAWARSKAVYWVMGDQPESVLIAHYGDTALFKKVDLKTKQLTDDLIVLKLSDSAPLKLRQVRLGALTEPRPMGKRLEKLNAQ